jgi:hypothetical protein
MECVLLFFVSIAKRSSDLRAEVERLKNSAPGKSRNTAKKRVGVARSNWADRTHLTR